MWGIALSVLGINIAKRSQYKAVTAGCPVPIVMAGGKKLPELEAAWPTTRSRRVRPASTWGATSSSPSTPRP